MLFDKRYKVYLDVGDRDDDGVGDGYFQVYPDSVVGLTLKPESGELFTRFGFEQLIFRNNPKLYADTSNDAYRVYNLIHGADLDQQINLKITMPANMIDPDTIDEEIGYLGQVDCSFDHDKKEVTITPSIVDQYTDVLENWETEVNVFGKNKIKKARFDLFSYPSTLYVPGVYGEHYLPVTITSTEFTETQETISSVIFTPSDNGAFIKNCKYEYDAEISIFINADFEVANGYSGTLTINLKIYNGDGSLAETNLLDTLTESSKITRTYSQNVTIPKGGNAQIIVSISYYTSLIYNQSILNISCLHYSYSTTDVNIIIGADGLQTRNVWDTTYIGRAEPKENDMIALTEYFEVDDSPKDTLLTNNSLAPQSVGKYPAEELYVYPNKQQILTEDKFISDITEALDSENSDYELSEVTIYKGNTFYKNIFGSKRRKVFCTCKYTRFEAWMPDAITPPIADAGWTAHPTIYNDNNEVLWTKLPYDGNTPWDLGSLDTTPGSVAGLEYHEKITSKRDYPNGEDSVTKPSRSLYEVTKTIYNGTHENLVNNDVKSCFFWNDANPDITVDSGVNYFTNEANFLNNIDCVHTYQFQASNPDSEDSVLKISLKNWLEDLKKFFEYQIYWYIDSDGDLWIEHIKHIDISKSYKDLTLESGANSNYELLREINSYDYDTSEMFATVYCKMANSGYKDFTDNEITYPKIASNKRNKDLSATRQTEIISTDIRYCIENPSDLDNGIVLINHDGSHNSVDASVPIMGKDWENGNLALSNILDKFMYEGVFTQGWLNGIKRDFEVSKRSKKGIEITLKGIYGYDFFKTIVGIGRIEQSKLDLDEETTTITLKYRFGSDDQTDIFELMVSMEGDYSGATDVLYDFGEV